MRVIASVGLALTACAGALAARRAASRGRRAASPGSDVSEDASDRAAPALLPLSEADGEAAYAHFQAGTELLAGGNPAQACVRLEKARNLAPDRCSIREALGRAYFALGRLPEAEAEFRAVVERSPSDDYAHFCLSRTLRRLGRGTEAGAHLKLARALRPGDPRYARLIL